MFAAEAAPTKTTKRFSLCLRASVAKNAFQRFQREGSLISFI